MIRTHREITGNPPAELMEKMRWLENYPDSRRLADELFRMGESILKSKHLIFPIIPTIGFLCYKEGDSQTWISYRRERMGSDLLEVCKEGPVESKVCTVYRKRGYELCKELDNNPEKAVSSRGIAEYLMDLARLNPCSVNWIKDSVDGVISNVDYPL